MPNLTKRLKPSLGAAARPFLAGLLVLTCLVPCLPATAEDGVAEYRALLRQYRNWEITSEEFNRRSKELIDKYGLVISPFGAPSLPSPASKVSGTPYLIVLGLEGAPNMAVLGEPRSEADCNAFIEANLEPTRRMIRSRTTIWFMDERTIVEWVDNGHGRGWWRISSFQCGPSIPGPPENVYQRIGLDFPAIVDQAVQQIRARGFDPG